MHDRIVSFAFEVVGYEFTIVAYAHKYFFVLDFRVLFDINII